MSKHRPALTEVQWREVFQIRCRSKRGDSVSQTELDLCKRAHQEDEARYRAMNDDVFDATVPFGSNVKAKRGPA